MHIFIRYCSVINYFIFVCICTAVCNAICNAQFIYLNQLKSKYFKFSVKYYYDLSTKIYLQCTLLFIFSICRLVCSSYPLFSVACLYFNFFLQMTSLVLHIICRIPIHFNHDPLIYDIFYLLI